MNVVRLTVALLFGTVCSVGLASPYASLTPRPKTVEGIKTPVLSLDGAWRFGEGQTIQVPGEWAMQGFEIPKGKAGVYEREVIVPEDWAGRTAIVRFDGVSAECAVYWDGVGVGAHKGGFVPFEIRLPGGAAPGKHLLRVEVTAESISDTLATASQYAAHQLGGILRPATLTVLPDVRLISERDVTTLHEDGSATLAWHISAENLTGRSAEIRVTLTPPHGDEAAASATWAVPAEGGSATLSLKVAAPQLWTSETPHLYTLAWSAMQEGKPLSTGARRVGLRTVRVEGNRLLVNGRPVKLMAVNRHEVHPLTGRSISAKQAWEDARIIKACNVNTVRTSHYPPSEAFLEACDEMGLFVECEAALCWIQHHANAAWRTGWNWLDRRYLPYMVGANRDMVRAYGGHPSIILWSLGNESRWSPLWEEVQRAVKASDPTRPIVFHDQCWGGFNNAGNQADVANYHYPSEANPQMWSEKGKPVWFGEYAHVQCYNRMELEADPGIRADWGRPLARMVDLMWEHPGCLGGAIWSGIDDVFCLPDGRRVGYGHWGSICDGWRRAKPESDGVRNAYSPVRVWREGRTFRIQNRQNFSSLEALQWEALEPATGKATGAKGEIPLRLAPHAMASVTLPEGEAWNISVRTASGVFNARYGLRSDWVRRVVGQPLPEGLKPGAEGALVAQGLTLPAPLPALIPLNGAGGAAGPAGSVLADEIPAFTPIESDWRWRSEGKRWVGGNAKAEGTLELLPQADGSLLVRYALTVKEKLNPRQWGLVLTLPKGYDRFAWGRISEGLVAETGFDPTEGVAEANPFIGKPDWRVPPKQVWGNDANALGSNAFRATRRDLSGALLSADKASPALAVLPEAEEGVLPAVRVWKEGDLTRLLVAGFSTGGSDGFFASHYAAERRLLNAGDTVRGAFRLRLCAAPR